MKKFLAVFVLIMLCAFSAFAKQVTADGFGSTVRSAEQDALRNAVESAMGTVVDSHTLSEEHLLIEDRVLLAMQNNKELSASCAVVFVR